MIIHGLQIALVLLMFASFIVLLGIACLRVVAEADKMHLDQSSSVD